MKNAAVAGVIGDSFGVATSLFSSFAFIAGAIALILQISESKQAGERDAKQAELSTSSRGQSRTGLAYGD